MEEQTSTMQEMNSEALTRDLVLRMLHLNFVAIHTTSTVTFMSIYHLIHV